jgi:uncharacterized protein with HEPN domain/predicted nucleotidyltransferase
MKKRSDGTFLLHIYEALNDIVSYTSDGQAEFFAEKMRQDAIERKFEIIGEAVKNLSQGFLEKYPNVDWSYMAKFRDLLSHHYFGIDLDVVWSIAQEDVPQALRQIKEIPEFQNAKQQFDLSQEHALDFLLRKQDEIRELAERFNVSSVKVFGEIASRTEKYDSVFEFLFEHPRHFSLFDQAAFLNELTILLRRRVSLVSRDCQLFKEHPELFENAVEIL